MMRTLTIVFFAALALAPTCRAQSREGSNAHLRDACRLATQVLTKGRPEPQYDWAVDFIGSCDQSAGEALAAVWRIPPADTADLDRIVRASYQTRDGRIFGSVLHAAGDPALPTRQRVAAISVIATYLDPLLVLLPSDLVAGSRTIVRSVSHSPQRDGAVPVAPSDLQAARDLLVRLAGDSDPALAFAADKAGRLTR